MLAKLFGHPGISAFSPFRTMEDQLQNFMTFGGTSLGKKEMIEDDYLSVVQQAYKQSGPVFACILARGLPFSEARFQFQEMRQGRPGLLFGNQDLSLLENPWTNATTGELLMRMEQHVSLAGNFYGTVVNISGTTMIKVLRPDWVTIISGVRNDPEASPYDLQSEILGYIYQPTTANAPPAQLIMPDKMIHWAPIPDPEAQWRGMSWITPVINEIEGDAAAQSHKTKFFENGTTASMVVTYDATRDPKKVAEFKKIFDDSYSGKDNAFKVIHMGGGADLKALGTDMKSLDFAGLSGSAETRIAAAAGVGSIIARFSEGMSGSSLNSGNYNSAKRQFADMTLRPQWRSAAAALSKPAIVVVPGGSRLWYDDRDIMFLHEDAKDAAEIQHTTATTMKALIDSGFDADAVIDAVSAGDLLRLKGKHTGFFSVQLQPPGSAIPSSVPPKQPAETTLPETPAQPLGA